MSEHITFQDFLLFSLILSTVLMLTGLALMLITLPAPQPEDLEEEIVITSAPTWYGDLKAKAGAPVDIQALQREAFYKSFYDNIDRDLMTKGAQLADPEALIKIEIGKLQQMQIIESFNQASSLYPPQTPDNKPSGS